MESWFSHTITAIVTAILVYGSQFVLKFRQQGFANSQVIIADLRTRIQALERRIDEMQNDHVAAMTKLSNEHIECVRIQAELRGQVNMLLASVKGESGAGQFLRKVE